MPKKKKILILGVTGQDGSFLAKFLIKKKFKVHGMVRKSATGNLNNLNDILKSPNFTIHHGDLLDLISIQNLIKNLRPDEIYNFADQDHVRWSFEIPSYSFDITSSVIKILEIVKNYSHDQSFSTFFVYLVIIKDKRNCKFTPLSIYALNKVSAYYACEMYKI